MQRKNILPSREKVLGLGCGLPWPSLSLSAGTFFKTGGRRATLGEPGLDGESGTSSVETKDTHQTGFLKHKLGQSLNTND